MNEAWRLLPQRFLQKGACFCFKSLKKRDFVLGTFCLLISRERNWLVVPQGKVLGPFTITLLHVLAFIYLWNELVTAVTKPRL